MLEIIFLIWAYKKLANIAEDKWRSRSWGWLGVGCWVLGEILGAVVGVAVARSQGIAYVCALLGAIIGIIIASTIVKNLAELSPPMDTSAFD